ncbi:uncharacterized protein CTRU02_211129 [Colletotrichum truncatum]|uniref:Uncharacterized protein n=1 Tax=Colletotrichum truncatum TaxID=5467 RepID=A0ACC3YQY0_COLTU|nr:uncharacterized protein CTRU02_01910 [Colletotrichum truncatum]KAF6799039.1 hypothetical protein CTRU02_01910 [Colletotrichum truncatum]
MLRLRSPTFLMKMLTGASSLTQRRSRRPLANIVQLNTPPQLHTLHRIELFWPDRHFQ